MNVRSLNNCVLAALLTSMGAQVAVATPIEVNQAKIEAMEREQERLLNDLKAKVEQLKGTPRYDDMKARLDELEGKIQGPRTLFISGNSKMTQEMRRYFLRMQRRIEDCGSRNFPTKSGVKYYGSGLAEFTIDLRGVVIKSAIDSSSGNVIVDEHFLKVIQASSPFGEMPRLLVPGQSRPYDLVVVLTPFYFMRDDAAATQVAANERCKWQ